MTYRLLVTLFFTASYFISMGQVADFIHDFVPGSSNSCAPISIAFTDQSTGASTYVWSIDGVPFSTTASPRRTFAQGGSFLVCLVVSDGSTSHETCQPLNISNPAEITITNAATASCAPYATTIDITSNETISNATVDFGDGAITVLTPGTNNFSASHTYSQEGVYSVTVSVEDANGCSSTAFSSNLVTIRNVKDLGFSVFLSDCQTPLSATFSNTSANMGNYRFDWDFGDGNTGTNTTNATYFYEDPGSFDVTLTATDLLTGCIDTYAIEDAISSESITTMVTTEVDNGDCSDKQINFSLTNLPKNATVSWNFGDGFMSGGATTIHNYIAQGNFTPVATITTASGCVFDVTNGSPIISIGPNDPSLSMVGDLETCNPVAGTTIQHTANSTKAVSWMWDFNNNAATSTQKNPSHTYTGNGIFQPTLTTTYEDGCVQVFTDPTLAVTIKDPTLRIWTDTTTGCVPFNVMFQVNGSNDPITSIDWTFGTGATPSTITDNAPNVTFTAVGDYDVTAVVNTSTGCSYPLVVPGLIEAGDIPAVNFQIDTLASCVDSPLKFTDLSTPVGGVDEWEWDFGDGGNSMEQNPTHEYAEADSFQVILKAYYNGCPGEFIDTNYVQIGEPKSDFKWKLNCSTLNTVDFEDKSTGADSVWWNFTDVTQNSSDYDNVRNFTYTFPGEGIYTVTQWTKNNTTGCIDDEEVTINLVNPVAQFDIRDTTFCRGSVIDIKNLSANIYNIRWSIKDDSGNDLTEGSSSFNDFEVIRSGSGGSDAQIRFWQVRNYAEFTLHYSIDPLCAANREEKYTKTVRVDDLNVEFSVDVDGCLPANIIIDHSAATWGSAPVGDPTLQYYWQMSSNQHADVDITGPNPNFTVTETGFYEINLRMTNGAGCDAQITQKKNVVIDTTDINFTWELIDCTSKEVAFVNTSSSASANAYEWDFGDGESSSASTTSHRYDNNGDYDVTLIIHTSTGCSDTLTKTIQVYDPVASFTGDNLSQSCPLPALVTNFTNTSTGASSYEWDFGTGGASTLEQPAHAFSSVNTFDVTLIATSVNGCTDTLVLDDYIDVGGPFAELEYSSTATCTGTDIEFVVIGDGVAEYTWDFGDGNALSSVPTNVNDTIAFSYAVPGKYQPILIAEDVSGCRISYVGVDFINIFDLTADFTADNLVMCSNDVVDVNFTSQISTGSVIDSIRWFFPGSDTPTAIGTDVSGVTYTTTGQYDVTMIAYTDACTDTLVKTAYIEVFDPPTFTAPRDTAICINSGVQFDITDLPLLTYSWDNGASLNCDDCPNPVASPLTTTTYTITGTSPGGCSTTRTVTVTVDELTTAAIPNPMASLCVGADYQIDIRSDATNLEWTTTTQTLKCTDCNDQEITVDTTGTVTVAYDYLSCRITEVLLIDAWNPADINESASTRSICPGDQVDLARPAYPGTVEWRASDINSAPLTATTHTPSVDTRYYVSVMHHGCTVVDSFDITIDQPRIDISEDITICIGDTAQLIADGGIGYFYVWNTPNDSLSCDDCPNPLAFPAITTTYQVTGDNGNGCTADATITVTVNDNVTSDALPDTIPLCIGATETLSLPATVSNVNWTSVLPLTQTNGLTTDVTASVSEYVEVSYVKDFCTITETVFIYVWDQIVDAGMRDTICQGDEVILSTNYPGSIEWRAGSMTATPIVGDRVFPTTPTRYYLRVTNHGCDAIDSLDIDIDLPSVTASRDTTICLGESTPITVSGDVNINSFVWDSSIPGLSCYPCVDPIATPDTTLSYVVLATNTNGCTARDTVVITVNDSIPNFLADTIDVCLGEDVDFDLSLSGVTNVTWVSSLGITTSNGDLEARITASDSTIVDVTYDWNTCTYTERIIFQPWDPSTVDAGIDDLVCFAEQVVLPLSPYGTTTWRTDSLTGTPLASNIINPTKPTTYYMEVSYNGCTGVDDIFIDIDLPMITTSGDETICLGDAIPLTVTGDAGNTYVWSPTSGLSDPNIANPMASPNGNVTYTVTGTNLNGCSVSEDLVITVNNPQSKIILQDTLEICLNYPGQVSVIPNPGTTNLLWSTNIAGAALSCTTCDDPSFTATDTGTVTLTYEYQACTFTETIYIDTWDPKTLDAGQDQLMCIGDTIALNTNYDGIVEWREGSLTSPALFVPEAHPSTDTWYYLSVTRHGCTGVDSLQIRLNQPVLEVDQPDPICVGTTIPLYVRAVSDPSVTFAWDSNQSGLSGCFDCPTPEATPQYTSTYTVLGTNSFGCTDTANITVIVHQDTIDLIPDTIFACINGTTDILLDIVKYPGVDTSQIFWATNIPIDCQCYHPQLSVNQSGPMVLNYKYKSCFKTENVYVVAWDPSTVDAGPDQTICSGEEIQLDRNYPGEVEWYFDSMTSTSLTGSSNTPTQSGRYYLRVDNVACSAVDSMDVTVLQSADISGSSYEICEGDSIQIDVIGSADSVLFNNAQSLDDPRSFSPWASPTISTVYNIVGHSNGCAPDTASIEVIVNENPTVSMRLPAEFIEGDEIRLQAEVNATDNLSYIWTPGDMIDCSSCQLPLFTPTESTLVSLTVTNDDTGCMASDTATITQKYVCSDNSIVMASAFSPNNDGLNDHIKPVSLNQITDFQIYNRWGELVYRGASSGLGWDGTYNGTELKPGVYVWIAEGICRFDGRILNGKGDFMLVR